MDSTNFVHSFLAFGYPRLNYLTNTSQVASVTDNTYTGQGLGKRQKSTQMEDGQVTKSSFQDIVKPMFDRFFPKRRRLNQPYSSNAGHKRMMDLEDDVIDNIFLALIGGERLRIARPRQLKNLFAAYPFINTNRRINRIFRTYICAKIHTLDAIYPLERQEEDEERPLRHALPEGISFLSVMGGNSLRVLRLPGFIGSAGKNEICKNYQLTRLKYLMTTIAQNCTQLREMAFQDAGSVEDGIGELLFSRNPRLKKVQVDVPGPDLLWALNESECVIQELSLYRVQTTSLAGLKSFLLESGGSLRKLVIQMCLPLDPGFDPTPANKARCRRREKSFTEAIEEITRTKMTSLRTLFLEPDRRAAWFKTFIKQFQTLGQADLVVGRGWLELFYPAGKIVGHSKPLFRRISMDLLQNCYTQDAFQNYMSRIHEPHTVSIVKSGFSHIYMSERNENLEQFVQTAIFGKGKSVKQLQVICPFFRLQSFEAFLETIAEILNFFEEKFESLDQFQVLRIPIHTVTYLGQGIGYETFLARLSNLKVLHLIRTSIDTEVSVQVPMGIPTFLRGVMNAYPMLESIYISNKDFTKIGRQENKELLKRAVEDAVISLEEYEEANPRVDVWALRKQLSVWTRQAVVGTV